MFKAHLSRSFSLTDIVVGAPYEEEQEGAIYIYNGCKIGIFPKFSKRIPGSDVLKGIKSFGSALSSSYDMNEDTVNGKNNPIMTNRLAHHYHLDESTFICRGLWIFFFISFF